MIKEGNEETRSVSALSEETGTQNKLEQDSIFDNDKEKSGTLNELEQGETDKDSIETLSEYLNGESSKNNVYISYRIVNNHGVLAGDDAKFENISFKGTSASREKYSKASVFKDKNALPRWLSDNYESYPMALMIATAVFDSLPYAWIIQAATRLFQTFDYREKADCTYAMTEILSQFEAEICKGELNTYTGDVSIDIVHLLKTEYQEKILRYIWQQYPQMQDKIMNWLQSYNTERPFSMSKRALETMALLVDWDYYYFQNNMVSRIANDKNIFTDMMIGQILIYLNQKEEYKKNVFNLLKGWSKERQLHYLLTTLFVCAQLQDKDKILEDTIECYIQRTLEEMNKENAFQYQANLYDFLGVGIRSYTFYRLLIEQLYDRVNEDISSMEKHTVYGLFLKLFAIDISQSNPENGEDVILIKLCMSSHTVTEYLCFLWRMVWQCSYYRKLLYHLMVLYDAKVYKTSSVYCIEKFIHKVLKDIYTKEMRKDICNKIHRRAGNE